MKTLIAGALLLGAMALPVAAQDAVPSVSVSGEGVVESAPDVATLRVSVVTEDGSIRTATDANAQRMKAVRDAILAVGVPQSRLRTEQFSVQPFHAAAKDGRTPQITGYTVRNTLAVRIKGTQLIGTVIEKAGTAGANEIYGPEFSVDENPETLADARMRAVKDARAKAEAYASGLGASLGRVLSVTESDAVRPPRPFMADMRASAMSAPPIEAGTQDIRAKVTVTWEIVERKGNGP